MKIIKPTTLKPGNRIGVMSPSRHLNDPGRRQEIETGIKILENFGFKVVLSQNIFARKGSAAGTPKQRADDFNALIDDAEIKAVVFAMGGDRARDILPLINYQHLRRHPKIVTGFSDNTNLLLAIYKLAGLITIHGPNLNNLARINADSKNAWHELLTRGLPAPLPNLKVLHPGTASGNLIGGNLSLINQLGKKYCPSFENAVIFWEEVEDALSITIEKQIDKLMKQGYFPTIKGMIIGKLIQTGHPKPVKHILKKMILNATFPVLKTNCFGHGTRKFFPLPVGTKIKIDTKQKNKLVFEEPVLK